MTQSRPREFGKVAVLMGGISAEREVSLRSGQAVYEALLSAGVDAHSVDATPDSISRLVDQSFDRAFIVLHGRWGEDGVLQGALETAGIPYTGSGVLGCALAMDKVRSKQIWQAIGLPTAPYRLLRSESDLEGLIDELGLPLFLKPNCEGSSVGVGKVTTADQLHSSYLESAKIGDDVLAESFLAGQELTVAILDGSPLPVVRMQAAGEFYDYHAKYQSDETQYFCPAGLSPNLEEEVRSLAMQAFEAVNCSGWGRVDIMLDASGRPFLLEVNPVPGMTDHSLVPMAAREEGISFSQLVVKILEASL